MTGGSVASLLLLLMAAAAGMASAQPTGWRHVPSITAVGPDVNDVRLGLLDEAVTFWNGIFEEIGSGFRLGGVTRVAAKVPDRAMQYLSDAVRAEPGAPQAVQRHRARAGPCDRPAPQRRFDQAHVRPPGAVPARRVPVRQPAVFPAHRRGEARARYDVPYWLETSVLMETR